jgi:Putative peptidoglycan binding domain
MNQVKRHLSATDDIPNFRSDCPDMVWEYCRLAAQKQLSEADADRLHEILVMAESDGWLDFWLNEADHFLAHELSLTSQISIHNFENQQARLREYLHNQLEEDGCELLQDLRQRLKTSPVCSKDIQQNLKDRGFDPGSIDGVLGPRTHSALIAFQEANQLLPTGLPDLFTQKALGLC